MTAALAGCCAVVTGGGSGVGAAIVQSLLHAGARVAILSRGAGRSGPGAQASPGPGHLLSVACDVRDPARIDQALGLITRQFGPPGILVNAAGTFGPIARAEDCDAAAWQDTLSINLLAPYLFARAVIPAMRAGGWGRIINVGSAASLHPPGPLTSAYAVSKAGLDRLTRQLASELAGSGVTANVIHPGELKTLMWQDIRDRAECCGAEGAGLRAWAEMVGATGGDPPQKAADLVMRIILDGGLNGRFLWIEQGLQAPLASWDWQPLQPVFSPELSAPTPASESSATSATATASAGRAP